jgi:putative heme-binding domain-containing protein
MMLVNFRWCFLRQNGDTGCDMDEKNEADRPESYRWPWFLLGMVVLGFVLAVIWMSVLVHRIHEQREYTPWPTPSHPVVQTNFVPDTNAAPQTNSAPATNAAAPTASVDPVKAERMAEFADTLSGGNEEAGRKVFFESPAANCGKCHKAGGQGGDNGPVLDGIGARQSREFIMESILFPNAVINTNFQTIVALLNSNIGISGTLKSETETNLLLITPEDGPVTVQKSDIKQRWIGASPMPEGIWQLLSKQELRDVIEFVATLKGPGAG